jgi:hypothetical protein
MATTRLYRDVVCLRRGRRPTVTPHRLDACIESAVETVRSLYTNVASVVRGRDREIKLVLTALLAFAVAPLLPPAPRPRLRQKSRAAA